MKRFILLLFGLMPLCAMAQGVTFDQLMQEYSSKPKCTTINISNTMIQYIGAEIAADYVRAIAIEDAGIIPTARKQIAELVVTYEMVMQVHSDDELVEIYQRTNSQGEVVDMVMITISDEECMMLYIKGRNLKLENATSLIKH
ncbi:MAG: DUF4252 domain-containing protein [Alistipes sp.]|nr:DUF4252 domain-containing protein [Alistipes sp.]